MRLGPARPAARAVRPEGVQPDLALQGPEADAQGARRAGAIAVVPQEGPADRLALHAAEADLAQARLVVVAGGGAAPEAVRQIVRLDDLPGAGDGGAFEHVLQLA